MAPADIKILSAGAVAPGLKVVVAQYERDTGHRVQVAFATAPALVKRIGADETIDVVIAPPAVLDELTGGGKASAASQVKIGRIGVGVMVRDGSPQPQITTVEKFKLSMLDANSLVYNQASTGIYLETLFERLGIGAQIKAKSTRYPDFAGVLNHMSHGKSGEIGFGATTVIIENARNAVKFVGPLPEEIQNYTAYSGSLTATGAAKATAQQFISYLVSPTSKSLFAAAGIE